MFVAGVVVMLPELVQCRFSDSSTCPPALNRDDEQSSATCQHPQDAHEQAITKNSLFLAVD